MTSDLFGLLAPDSTESASAVFHCALEHERLEFRDPFRIARAEPDHEVTTVIVEAVAADSDDASQLAYGEAFPVAYYGETLETIEAVVPMLHDAVGQLGAPPAALAGARGWLERASAAMDAAIGHHGGAKCGLDIALHDLVGQRLGLPVYELLEMSPEIPPTDFSLGLDEPTVVAERAARAAHFPALKIKVGGPADIETLEAVRAVYAGPLRVDANTGWEPDQAVRIVPELVRLGVELIEQPFPAHRLDQLRWLQERSDLPIVADESAVTDDDLGNLTGVVAGVNVKLTNVGGVGPAARMIRRARERGFKIMLGCMEETTVGIAAAAAVASLADWVDLDGNLLIANDPFAGLELSSECRWQLASAPGLAVRRRTD